MDQKNKPLSKDIFEEAAKGRAALLSDSDWICESCKTLNSGNRVSCSLCGSSRLSPENLKTLKDVSLALSQLIDVIETGATEYNNELVSAREAHKNLKKLLSKI